MRKIPLILPPLNEQKRIVEKLEKLLGKVEDAKVRLDKIPAILRRFRQSVLTAACAGKLTADWRAENNSIKTANDLLTELVAKIDYERYLYDNESSSKSAEKKWGNLEIFSSKRYNVF